MENGFLMSKKYKIVVTGGSGRFGKKLKSLNNAIYLFPNKKKTFQYASH